jgi:DNA (cytosine-5)-methyltransferase 1
VIEDQARAKAGFRERETVSDLQVVEICAGAGGQSLGLHRAGFDHLVSVEIDGSAAATLRHNLSLLQGRSADVREGDVADESVWDPRDFHGVDLVAGGVPCPPFSIAGKQLGSSDERDLFAWAVELAGSVEPRALLLENVRGLASQRFAGYRQAVADRLAELGYWSEWRLLHASDYDVPQLRPRFVLVAMRPQDADYFSWPEPIPTTKTVGTELRNLMAANRWPKRHVERWVQMANDVAPTIVGGSKKHGGADLGPTRAKRAWAALGVDGLGIANEAPDCDHPSPLVKLPRLTNEMVARLQGWSGDGYAWEFLGRKTSVYRQIGNAFPPPVAEAVGVAIRRALAHAEPSSESRIPVVHDDVYRLLTLSGEPLTLEMMVRQLGPPYDASRVTARLDALRRDFILQELETEAGLAYGLGSFRAFRGQEDHVRHEHFQDKKQRSRVS